MAAADAYFHNVNEQYSIELARMGFSKPSKTDSLLDTVGNNSFTSSSNYYFASCKHTGYRVPAIPVTTGGACTVPPATVSTSIA